MHLKQHSWTVQLQKKTFSFLWISAQFSDAFYIHQAIEKADKWKGEERERKTKTVQNVRWTKKVHSVSRNNVWMTNLLYWSTLRTQIKSPIWSRIGTKKPPHSPHTSQMSVHIRFWYESVCWSTHIAFTATQNCNCNQCALRSIYCELLHASHQ